MDADFLNWLPIDTASVLLGSFNSDILVAGFIFLLTATLIAMCIPGVLIPMAIGSGALLGPWGAAASVALGAAAGSQLFFLAARHLARDRLQARLGDRLQSFEQRFARHGLWYLIGLRLLGAPQVLVASGSALMPIRSTSFAAATLLGLLPAILIASATGSSI